MNEISAQNIEAATQVIDPVFLNTPQIQEPSLSRTVSKEVTLKLEMFNPVRSFKGRGASYYMNQIDPGQHVVTASAGNFGQAIAYAGTARGTKVTVYCAENANPIKVSRMKDLGAEVVQVGTDFDTAKEAAKEHAEAQEALFVEDGYAPQITEGAGTIGIELAQVDPDAVVVPVGNGALATGIGCWIKVNKPNIQIIGVSAAGAPAMTHAWKTGEPAPTETAATIADGVAVRVPVPSIIPAFREYVDDMLLVDEASIHTALQLIRDKVGLILEPAGALGIAALLQHEIRADRVATVATGSNYSDALLNQLTSRS